LQGFFVKMTAKRSPSIERKQRSDAQQNRERILAVARKAFTKSGANASLEDVAKQAGVGIGTLYRHFSSREELLKAVYYDVTEKLAKAGQEFAETLPPVEALRAWMMLFVDFIAEKQIIAPALNALVDDPRKLIEASYSQTWGAVRALVKRAIKSGDIREDLDAIDLLRALIGVANIATTPDWKKSARKLVDILILGSRPIK
jgi:AcrR family transcriptional regulator